MQVPRGEFDLSAPSLTCVTGVQASFMDMVPLTELLHFDNCDCSLCYGYSLLYYMDHHPAGKLYMTDTGYSVCTSFLCGWK